jgi:poly(A) polymerase
MTLSFKEAFTLCNTICRNGYEAYIINARLQKKAHAQGESPEIDIAADLCIDELMKLFPQAHTTKDPNLTGVVKEGGVLYRFYPANVVEGSHPETTVCRLTPRLLEKLSEKGALSLQQACSCMPHARGAHEGFNDFDSGEIAFVGLPEETLRRDYLLAVRALRFSANYNLPIEPNTWMAIVRGASRLLDYVPASDIMDEWRKVEAENLYRFARMLHDALILHGLIPEVAALSRVKQIKNETGAVESVLDHTIEAMRRYPEVLPYDWYGVMACLFHDVGKLFTAENIEGRWTFHGHALVGAKVTRKILTRLRFAPEDVDLICHLVRRHMHFNYMLTDKGVRRFMSLDEYPRLIEMARASIKAREGSYAAFNHNRKIMERANTPEEMLEPLLNGNEIMDFAGLKPGPLVGLIRDALLQAQIVGDVTNVPEAVEFVCRYKDRERIA